MMTTLATRWPELRSATRLNGGSPALQCLAGIADGLAGARAVAAAVSGLLFDMRAGDPGPYVGVTILLAVIGLTACYVPESRAAASHPLRVLRND